MSDRSDDFNPEPTTPAEAWRWILETTNHFSGAIAALATVVMAVTTICYTIISFGQWEATQRSADAAKDAADAAKSAAQTASSTLEENERQYRLMFPEVHNQTAGRLRAAQGALKQSQRILEAQSDPDLSIIIKNAIATTVQPKVPHPDIGESKQRWEEMKARTVAVVYAIHNDGNGPALRFAAEMNFGNSDMGNPSTISREGVCHNALASFRVSSTPAGRRK